MAFRGDGEGYGGKGWRDRAFTYVYDNLRYSPWELFVADSGDDPFNISKSYNKAAREAGAWDKAILHPPDEWVPWSQLDEAVQRATNGMVYAFDREVRLTESGTVDFFNGSRMFVAGQVAERRPKPGKAMPAYSGPRVVTRETWEAVGGFDERIVGWGAEDEIFAHCVRVLGGPHERVEGEMISLYHPRHAAAPEEERAFFNNKKANRALWAEVRKIVDPDELREYIQSR